MHELTLFAHIPNGRVDHVKRALTAITGMSPTSLLEHHLLYKPKRNRQTVGAGSGGSLGPGPASAATTADFYFLKLVAEILDHGSKEVASQKDSAVKHETAQGVDDGDAMEVDSLAAGLDTAAEKDSGSQGYDVRKRRWAIRFADLPEVPGKRPVTSRMIHSAVVHEGDALAFVDSLGYSLISEYIIKGDYFVYHNTYITLTQVMLPKQPFLPFPLNTLQPLDPTESYVLQASIKVQNANEQETMNRGVDELKMLKGELRGVVDLEAGDRLSLDTRAR